jgi:hypothetical protein
MTKIWFLSPARELVKASHPPSGDHDGFEQGLAAASPGSSGPKARESARRETNASCFQSVDVTV